MTPASDPTSVCTEGHFPSAPEPLDAIGSFRAPQVGTTEVCFVLICIALVTGEIRQFPYFGVLLKSSFVSRIFKTPPVVVSSAYVSCL